MRPEDILTVEDYECPRALDEFEAWWRARFDQFAETREGRAFAREEKGALVKKFHLEAHPMLAFMRSHRPNTLIRCKLAAGYDAADAVYLDPSGLVVRKFQITMPVDGRTEKIRMQQLSRVGHVDGLAKLDEYDDVPDDALPIDQHARMREIADRLRDGIAQKSAKNYGEDFTLIVGIDDSTYYDEGASRLYRDFIGPFSHSFGAVHIVGVLGRILISYPPT